MLLCPWGFSRQEYGSGLPCPPPGDILGIEPTPLMSPALAGGFFTTSATWDALISFEAKWSEVAQSCPTLCDPMDCSLPDSSIHGVFQARILEWVVISFSRRSSQPRGWTRVSHIAGRCFTPIQRKKFKKKREKWLNIQSKNKWAVAQFLEIPNPSPK